MVGFKRKALKKDLCGPKGGFSTVKSMKRMI